MTTPNLEFAQLALESVEKRRNAVENKAAILIASNAIILAGTGSLLSALPTPTQMSATGGPQRFFLIASVVVALCALVAAVISVVSAIRTITTGFSEKFRRKLLGPSADARSLLYFKHIADCGNSGYEAALAALDERAILTQLATDVYHLSKFMCWRYNHISRAQWSFVVGAVCFTIAAVLTAFGR